jgi:transcriptional regulator with XRE-family HTH domain
VSTRSTAEARRRVVEPAAIPDSIAAERSLLEAIGRQVRDYRQKLDMSIAELAREARLSVGMLSKIENGMTSPSLGTLQHLSRALNVPVTALFRRFDEQHDATYVPKGEGLSIERRGTRAGHEYRLLGHSIGKPFAFEPFLITLTETSEIFPLFQHPGVEFIYFLEGEAIYRHGSKLYRMRAGDSLFFDSDIPHGPEEILRVPIQMISVMVHSRNERS